MIAQTQLSGSISVTTNDTLDREIAIAMIGSRGFLTCHSGLETHVRELAKALANRGHHVAVYGHTSRNLLHLDTDHEGVEARDVFCLSGKFTATISNSLWATLDAIRSGKFDILHFHGVGCVFSILLGRKYGVPTVLTLHSTNWHERKWSLLSRLLIRAFESLAVRSADEVIVVSNALETRLQSEYGIKPHVIPNGVYQKGMPERDPEVLRALGLELGGFVLYVGRLVPDKGCHVILDAFDRARLTGRLVFAGSADDKSYLDSLKEHASKNVLFPGYLGDMELGALYRNCSLFCSASVSEGQSIAVMEALAHGARCLASDIPAHRELINDTAMLFPVGDSSELCKRLIRAINYLPDPERKRSEWLGAHPQYQPEEVTEKALHVYIKLLGRTGRLER